MKQKDIKALREKIWLENNKKCPVLNKEIPIEKMALDHNHKTNSEPYSANKGTIRISLEFRVNAVLGKLENSIKRVGLDKEPGFNISDFLRNAADYFEKGAYVQDGKMFIHPKEVHKEPKVSKRNYNKCKKIYNSEEFIPKRKNQKKKDFPPYPKSKKLTKGLDEMFKRYEIDPYNPGTK